MICPRCNAEWIPRTDSPLKCPRCFKPLSKPLIAYAAPRRKPQVAGAGSSVTGRPFTKEQVDSPTFGAPAPRSKVSPQIAGVGVLEGSGPVPGEPQGSDHDVSPGKSCRACEEPMKAVKGKWVCSEQTCGLLGQAQGDAR